jgi:hypothetical protein
MDRYYRQSALEWVILRFALLRRIRRTGAEDRTVRRRARVVTRVPRRTSEEMLVQLA